jgi:hypothetical protein
MVQQWVSKLTPLDFIAAVLIRARQGQQLWAIDNLGPLQLCSQSGFACLLAAVCGAASSGDVEHYIADNITALNHAVGLGDIFRWRQRSDALAHILCHS